MSASKQKNEKLSSNPMGAASLAVLYNVWGEGDCGEPEGFIGAEESEDHMRGDWRLDQ